MTGANKGLSTGATGTTGIGTATIGTPTGTSRRLGSRTSDRD